MTDSEMQCPHCGNSDIWRLKRRRWRDRVLSYFNRWPYICQQCEQRFWADARWPIRDQPVPPPVRQTYAAPSATIEVRAETQQQLDQMLLSLNQAINQFQKAERDAPIEPNRRFIATRHSTPGKGNR